MKVHLLDTTYFISITTSYVTTVVRSLYQDKLYFSPSFAMDSQSLFNIAIYDVFLRNELLIKVLTSRRSA